MRCAPLALAALSLSLIACAPTAQAPAPEAEPPPDPLDPGAPAPTPAPIGLDAQGCLSLVDHYERAPLALQGRLVVSYYEPSLEATLCEWDAESNAYWCPSATATAADCAEEEGTHWCPQATPPTERLGDPQELGLFDLSRPAAGVQRWTENRVHEAEVDIAPDGTHVIYAVRAYLDAFGAGQGQGIWISAIDGSNPRRLTVGDDYQGIPTWAPPGSTRFTYSAEDGFYRFDLATLQAARIVTPGFAGYVSDPETSHDGELITFKSDVERANAPDIYVMRSDGSGVRRLTSGYSDHDPVFSRDNKKIYFERYYGPGAWDQYVDVDRAADPRINQWGIVELDVESGVERVVIPHDPCGKHFFWLPTLSPDGALLMFIHDYVDGSGGGYQDFWVTERSGARAQRVPGTRGFYWFDWGA